LTLTTSIALFVTMIVLALIPGPGVLIVTARTASVGSRHGLLTSLGILTGDFVFITLALLGLATLSSVLGDFFIVVKYVGALYLIGLGVSLFLATQKKAVAPKVSAPRYITSYAAGLLTTLSNPKAILFYLSFFPAFLDLSHVSIVDTILLYVIATVSVGGVMFGYVYVAYKAKSYYSGSSNVSFLKVGSGSVLIGSGLYVALRG